METKRLSMRPWVDSDVGGYRALIAQRCDGTPTIEDVRGRIVNQLAATVDTGIALLAVRRREENDFIGYCGLIVGRSTLDEPEIAFELYQRIHGCGYATEAARAVVDAAVVAGWRRLWATVRTWNAPSLRVLDKLGFKLDHVSEDERGELAWLTRRLP